MHKFKIRVYVEVTDRFGVVYHANYIKYFERARTEFLRQQGYSVETIYQSGYSLLVSKLDVKFLKAAKLDDELIIQTTIEKMKMSLVIFKQEILSLTGDLMTSANVKVVGLDKNNQLCNLTKIMSA